MEFLTRFFEALTRIIQNCYVGELSSEYVSSSTRSAIIFGLIGAILIVATAFLANRAKVLGVITAIMHFVGAFGAQKYAHHFISTELIRTVYGYGSSQSEAAANLEAAKSAAAVEMLMDTVPILLYNILFFAAWIITLIFIIRCLGMKGKVFTVFALIIHIVKYLAIPPVNIFGAAIERLTEGAQAGVDRLFCIATLIPTILLALAALITFIKVKRTPPEIVLAATDAAPEVEAAAAEEAAAPAEDAVSVEEAAPTEDAVSVESAAPAEDAEPKAEE